MQVTELFFPDVKLITPKVFCDERGFFKESYRLSAYKDAGINADFVQSNHSFSKGKVLRGMHFQRQPGQAKLVSVVSGVIYDVVVDIRPDSPTFKQWEGVLLDAKEHTQLFVPIGFAHGFCVVSEEAHVVYQVSSLYDPVEEKSFRFDDPEVGIKWPIRDPLLSDRDKLAPLLCEVV